MNDRISFDTLTALADARADQGTRRALHTALMGINASERATRNTIRSLRAALDDAEARLDAGQHPDDGSLAGRAATLDLAIAAGRIHWQAAAALLTSGELASLSPPPAVSTYPARADRASWPLLRDGYTITWAPDPAGCSLTLDKRGPGGGHAAFRGTGASMQDAWDQVQAQMGTEGHQAT
jgi:hypothetical protein